MSLYVPEFGNAADGVVVYNISVQLWEDGQQLEAITLMEMLIEHIESGNCERSKHWLLPRAQEQFTLMQIGMRRNAFTAHRRNTTADRSFAHRVVAVLLRKPIATALYYAVIAVFCIVMLGEPPGLSVTL